MSGTGQVKAGEATAEAVYSGIGDKDHIEHWLDGSYHRWKHAYRWPLQVAVVVVWLPAAFHLLQMFFIYKLPMNVGTDLIVIGTWMQIISPGFNWLIAVIVATLAAASLVYTPDVLLTTSKQGAYARLRRYTRRLSYKWFLGLMLIPGISANVIFSASMLFPDGSMQDLPVYRMQIQLVFLAASTFVCWIGAELSQYANLRYSHKSVALRITAVVVAPVVWICFVWLVSQLVMNILLEPYWLFEAVEVLSSYGLTIGAVIYMLLATRRPTPTILERL